MNPQSFAIANREQIVAELNLGHLKPEEQDEVIESVGELLFGKIFLKLTSLLPESVRDAFAEAMGTYDFASVDTIVKENIPNSAEVIAKELSEGIADYKKSLATVVQDDKKKVNVG